MLERKQIDKIIAYASAILVSALIMLVLFSILAVEIKKKPIEERQRIFAEQQKQFDILKSSTTINENLPNPWPPKMNEPYPDIDLIDQNGQEFKLSSLKGKIVIVEFIDMTSPISQAQSGAWLVGAYGRIQEIDKYTETFSDTLRKNTEPSIILPNNNIMQVKIIVYSEDGKQPSRDDAQNWASHFGYTREEGVIVSVARNDIRDIRTQELVTGFQLIDKNQILRVDSAGPTPKHNLKMTLVPLIPKLMR